MDSILISPDNNKDFQYVLELLETLDIEAKIVSEKDKDDFELAQLIRKVDATGIVREELRAIELTTEQKEMLNQSEKEILGKSIITEKQIQMDEDEWLNK